MDTRDVINELVKDLQAVQPVRPFGQRLSVWFAVAAAGVAAIFLPINARRDFALVADSSRLSIDVALVVLIALTAASGALRLSVPGEGRSWVNKYLPMALLVFWFFFSIVQLAADVVRSGVESLIPDPHVACALLVTGAGLLFMLPMTLLIRSAAPLDPRWCGALAALASGGAAMIGIELICVYERPAHMMVYHVLPVIAFTALGAWLGPRFVRLSEPK
jgi:hypothetical protein